MISAILLSGYESAKTYIENFEKYLNENRDSIEALRILYNSEDIIITHTMLVELRDRLLAENKQYGIYQIWKNYKFLDSEGKVEELDIKTNINALTHLIPLLALMHRKLLQPSAINPYLPHSILPQKLPRHLSRILQKVEELDIKTNINALTHLIQIVRYAYKRNQKLTSLFTGYGQRFNLYCGQNQRILTIEQEQIMRQIFSKHNRTVNLIRCPCKNSSD